MGEEGQSDIIKVPGLEGLEIEDPKDLVVLYMNPNPGKLKGWQNRKRSSGPKSPAIVENQKPEVVEAKVYLPLPV